MSQRRMFSQQIVDSDAFLDMSPTAQNLYFHLGMRADDDGFVGNPRKILRMVGGNDDDLKILLVKRFLLSFESGVVVIKHWKIHNLIRGDRYHETKYLEEKKTIVIKENGSYTELNRLPDGNQMAPEVRLGKVRIDNTNTATEVAGKEVNEVIFLFKEVNPSITKYYGNKNQRKAVERMLAQHGREKLESILKVLPQVNAKPYWPKSTTPCQLEDNLGKYKALSDSEKAKGQNNKFSFN